MRPIDRYLLALTALGAGLTACFLYIVGQIYPMDGGPRYGADFLNYWAAPQIASTQILALFSFAPYMDALAALYGAPVYEHQWSYPLHSLFFYAPFAALPYAAALLVWSLTGLAAYAAALRYAVTSLHARAMACVLLAPASLVCLQAGQNGLWIGAASLAVLVLMDRRHPWLAGLLLGCLTIKPQLFILWPLALLAMGAWRTFLAALLTAALLLALSLAVHGLPAWLEYLTHIPALQWELMRLIPDQAGPYKLMMPGLVPALRLLQVPLDAAVMAQWVVSVAVGAASLYRLRQPLALPQRALLLASASLLVTPYAFTYDMVFFTAALVLCWMANPPVTAYARWLNGLAFLLPAWVMFGNMQTLPLAPLVLVLVWRDAMAAKPSLR